MNKYEKWLKNRETSSAPRKINLTNIWRVIKAFFVKKYVKIFNIEWKQEQINWRLSKVDLICRQRETCKICNCFVEDLVGDSSSCEGNCYPPMMNKKEWISFKKQNKI